jgi:hypothetical protein
VSLTEISHFFYHVEPKFGPQESLNWEGSVYYWWWEYLRCNKDYKAYCDSPDLQQKRHRFKKLFEDFGDVHQSSFKRWWNDDHRGWSLFAELESNAPFGVMWDYSFIRPEDFVPPLDRLYISLPRYHQSKNELKKRLCEIVDAYYKGKPGKRTKKHTKVKYRVLGRPNIYALKLHLNIYKYREANPNMPLWQVAQNLKLFHLERFKSTTPDTDSRNTMSATVSRHLKKADVLIKNIALGRFPDYKDHG